jgi:hypothetical protein
MGTPCFMGGMDGTISASPLGGAAVTQRTCDILRYEKRGGDFALVRVQADGTRSELILSATNVVHLGMLAPDFARRMLANKVAEQSGTIGTFVKGKMVSTNVRAIELLLAVLDMMGWRVDRVMTERKARSLASKLVQKADELANLPRPASPRSAVQEKRREPQS